MMNKKLFLYVFLLLVSIQAWGQDISVIYVSGEAYSFKMVNGKEQYVKIVYGPLKNVEKIILKDHAQVRLLNNQNQIAELQGESEQAIKDITFQTVESNSVFSKFCNYFSTFFTDHSSAESKTHYQNNIYAISRGNVPPPFLDFPLSGVVPYDPDKPFPFSWTHACDSCEYIVNIYNYDTRTSVFAWTTNNHHVVLERPAHYLKPNSKYYWNVSISGVEMDYKNTIFTTADKVDYQTRVYQLEQELETSAIPVSIESKAIYIMQDFEEAGLKNYGIYYGLRQKKMYPENVYLADYLERYWFDDLLE